MAATTATSTAYKFPYEGNSRELEHVQSVVALTLATGVTLPDRFEDWPTGAVCEWNKAADAGAFEKCATLGDMARAFLAYRLEQLPA